MFHQFICAGDVDPFGTTLAILNHTNQRKEVRIMKIANSFLAGLLLIGSLGAVNSALADDDGVLLKQEVTPGSYCHEKFPAIRPSTIDSNHPTLKSSDTGDIIDFYGACDESPTGMDQVVSQKRDEQFRFGRDYED
jgi:hypothetical protein